MSFLISGLYGDVSVTSITIGSSTLAGGTNIIEQRNGTSGQSFYSYNTYTDASNYERAMLGWVGGSDFQVGIMAAAGTGVNNKNLKLGIFVNSAASLYLVTNNTTRWTVTGSGSFVAQTDNTLDIGASGANRPRDLFLGRNLNLVSQTPASASATGTADTFARDANFLYVCTATNTWKRVAIATW